MACLAGLFHRESASFALLDDAGICPLAATFTDSFEVPTAAASLARSGPRPVPRAGLPSAACPAWYGAEIGPVREICVSVLDVTCGGAGMPGYLAARPGDLITPQEAAEVLGLPSAEAEIWF